MKLIANWIEFGIKIEIRGLYDHMTYLSSNFLIDEFWNENENWLERENRGQISKTQQIQSNVEDFEEGEYIKQWVSYYCSDSSGFY